MAATLTGLGKGLDALIRETGEARDSSGVQTLLLADIIPNPQQPRRKFSEKALEELADSIRSQGVLQPLLVRPCGPAKPGKYQIVAGERRWRASHLAGLKEVPVLVRSFSAQDTLAAALIENLQREDLNPLEEALALQALKEEFHLSQDDLSQKIGKSRSAIANSLRLLSLPDSAQKDLADGKLSAGHARALLSVNDAAVQEELKNLILERHLSVREAEGLAAAWKEKGNLEAAALAYPGSDSREGEEADMPEAEPARALTGDQDTLGSRREKTLPQSARLLEIQARIKDVLQIPVRVTGKEEKGKISLSYNSKEELEALLTRLAAPALEGADHPRLAAREIPVLDASNALPLSGAARHSLEGASQLAALEKGNSE